MSGLLQGAAMLAAAGGAAAVLVLEDGRGRARAMLLALVLSAAALATIVGEAAADLLPGRELLAVAGAGVGLMVVGAISLLVRRWPLALPLLALAAVPFRLPIAVGDETANLLLPLYAVIAGGVVAHFAGWVPRRVPEPHADHRLKILERVLAVAIVLYAVQGLYSSDLEGAVKNVGFFYAPFAVLFALMARLPWSLRSVRYALGVVVGLALACAAVGFAEYATGHLLIPNPKVLAANELKPYFRVNSLFFDPNMYGRFLVAAMVPLAVLLLWARRRRDVWLLSAALAFLWGGVVVSLSQSSFAALLAGLAVIAALRWRPAPVTAGVVVAGLAAAAVLVFAPASVGLSENSERAVNRATAGRFELTRTGLDIARDNPVIGVGSAGFSDEYRRRERVWAPTAAAESHTIPLTVAAEQGAVGLLVYFALLGVALAVVFTGVRRGLREGERRHAIGRVALAATFCALIVHTLAYAAFLEDPLIWVVLAMAAAAAGWRPVATSAPREPAPTL